LKRPTTRSGTPQDRLYGRSAIFEKTIRVITSCSETLSVVSVVGPQGIGKTAFIQHLYNDARIEQHFVHRIWVCVSADFDVLKLTQQILKCTPATEEEKEENSSLDQLQIYTAQRRLKSIRFLLVLDDVRKCHSDDEWNTLLAPFTKGETKGSVVLFTTRSPRIAQVIKTFHSIVLGGLDPEDSLQLLEASIFGEFSKPDCYKDDLSSVARHIASELNGHPLGAKRVSRLLKKDISREHWRGVSERMEWLDKGSADFITSFLITRYDYLPFILQRCFSYCALFPKGHKYSHLEMNRFFFAVGAIDSTNRGDTNYLDQLVDYGFMMKGDDLIGDNYVMHDVLHGLSRSISAQECLNISGLDFKAFTAPQSIRHLSITIEDRYSGKFQEEMSRLKTRIDTKSLQTLMIFREYGEGIAEILKDAFKEVNNLQVLFIVVKSLDDLPENFSKITNLQYLKLGSPCGIEIALPSTLSRFYNLKSLDLQNWHGSSNLPKDISHLSNLQNFVAKKELHSSVPEVGMMKHLRELKEFCVKKERLGFELRELGKLTELGGELRICNLGNVATKEEASEAKLMSKENLKRLTLVWGRNKRTVDSDILDALQPHPNLRELHIANYGGDVGPSWLCADILLKNLEALHLEGVPWDTLPPFRQLPQLTRLILTRISRVHQLGIQYMTSLKSLIVCRCGNIFSGLSMGGTETMKPFPASLKKLGISSESGIESMALLSNLTSLTHLTLQDCVKLTVDGFNPLITVNLKVLVVFNCRWDRSCPESIAAALLSEVASSRVMPAGSFQLEQLKVDSISAVLVTPICNLVASTLHTLIFSHDQRAKNFTEEQEKALQLLTSLRHLRFDGCGALQSLPRGLHRLSSLQDLDVLWCPELRSIPKEGFPVSLRNLRVRPCSADVEEQIEKLGRRNPDLSVLYK